MRTFDQGSGVFTLLSTTFFVAATAVATTAFWPIYQTEQFILMAAATIVVGCAIAIAGARFRWPGPVMVGVTVATYLLLGVPLAIPDSALFRVLPSGEGLLELIRAAALGWRQLLTIALPVGSYQSLLVPAFLIILVTVIIGLSLALRIETGELGVLAPTLVLVLGLAFGPREAPTAVPLVLGFLAVVLGWLSWRRWYRRRESIRALATSPMPGSARLERLGGVRSAAAAIAILLVAVAVGGLSANAAPPEREREVLRDIVDQPFDPRDYSSPLSSFRRYQQPSIAGSAMFTVRGLPAGARLRLATLDTYDGVVFSVGSDLATSDSGSFTRLPTSIERDLAGERVELEVEISGYEGIWVPTTGLLSSISFWGTDAAALTDSFFFNDGGHSGVVLEGLDAGDRYTLDAVIPAEPSSGRIGSLSPGDAAVPPAAVVPEELTVVLDTWVRGAETAGERLEAMLSALAAEGYVSHGIRDDEPVSRSGHGADRIQELLTSPRMIGDEEQYSVTAALMARAIGFPSRVVFGFAPEPLGGEDDTTVVLGSDVSAWIEVDTAQFGWVAIDPTPPEREIPEEEPEDPTEVARPQSPVPPPAVEPDPSRDQIPLDTSQEDEEQDDPFVAALLAALTVLAWIAAGILVVLAPFLAIVIAKLRRRYLRQRAASAAARVSGGWREFEDMTADYGYSPPPSPTRSEVAEAVGGVRPLVLAAVADRAVFAPERVDEDEAREVWVAVRELEEDISSSRTRWQRVKAAVSLRSLAGYSLKELFSRERRPT
ncbi:transglutaminase domain-containing protein [Salinibacterium sp. SYSU T00001]|uniref:transglutaminase domain-containing protein n=1 Tax=Homoserinimonas sedimenticola TaxID=2986805 RepID=UPI0022360765|nr:transglutaminase domain-containing protein [Salinibacterium sedimenticola]MCW4386690.1 transglutaminase domain-containing protein [Salinibacterium sedimenticola]